MLAICSGVIPRLLAIALINRLSAIFEVILMGVLQENLLKQ